MTEGVWRKGATGGGGRCASPGGTTRCSPRTPPPAGPACCPRSPAPRGRTASALRGGRGERGVAERSSWTIAHPPKPSNALFDLLTFRSGSSLGPAVAGPEALHFLTSPEYSGRGFWGSRHRKHQNSNKNQKKKYKITIPKCHDGNTQGWTCTITATQRTTRRTDLGGFRLGDVCEERAHLPQQLVAATPWRANIGPLPQPFLLYSLKKK